MNIKEAGRMILINGKMQKGDKVIAYWVSDEIGVIIYINPKTGMADIKYQKGKSIVTEHISRLKLI
ncbi:hypothetical protein ACGE0T_14020 [Parabacteroides sp. APC149_11_2_Y6]